MNGTFEVRHPEVEQKLKDIGNNLREACPKGFGFVLLIMSFGPGGSVFYTSNGDRKDIVAMMKEFIAKQEGHA